PANSERAAAFLVNFDRNLIGGSSYPTRLYLDGRAHVFDRAFEKFQGFIAGLFANLAQGVVERSLRDRTLPTPHDSVDELCHQRTVVNRIRKNRASFSNSASRHKLLRASLRTLGAVFCTALLAIADSDRIQRAPNHVIANARQL